MTFFVDGRQVCALTREPFECEWDAGPSVAEHQIRAVATLTAGGRVVQTIRTKGIGYATRSVNVDVVQVTVTVSDDRGKFIPGLPRSAFHVFEDNRAADRSPISPRKMCRSNCSSPSTSAAACRRRCRS